MAIRVWGLTGLIGSGKSAALAILRQHACPTLDADWVARQVVDPSRPEGRQGLAAVKATFGDTVLASDGGLDRAALRAVIARDPAKRDLLEGLLHPLILEGIEREIQAWSTAGERLGVIEGTRLIEAGYAQRLAGLIVVSSEAARRLERVRLRDGIAEREVQAISALQNGELMLSQADVVWTNDGNLAALEAQVVAFLKKEGGRP